MKNIYKTIKSVLEAVSSKQLYDARIKSLDAQLKPPKEKKAVDLQAKGLKGNEEMKQAEIDREDAKTAQSELLRDREAKMSRGMRPTSTPMTSVKPSAPPAPAAKPAAPSASSTAPAPKTSVPREAEKSGPDVESMKKNIISKDQERAPEVADFTASTVKMLTKDVKPIDTVSATNKNAASETPVENPSADETTKNNILKTITKTKKEPAMESNVNKKFNVSDALYQSVMEVMKKDKKEGSIPRNDKEKELAAAYGDPKRITHGDVLKMRGVTKEEIEQTDEATLSAKAARAGKDIGAPGKNFSKIAASAAKRYGSEEAGKRVAGAVLKKMRMKEEAEQANEGIMDKVLPILTGGSDKDLLKKLQKDMGVPQTGQKPAAPAPAKPMKENKDTPGNGYAHQCAVHVKSESFGEGRTITTQHADPDADGNIAWYDVMFEHGIEKQVPTSELEILVSENHMHMKKKKM